MIVGTIGYSCMPLGSSYVFWVCYYVSTILLPTECTFPFNERVFLFLEVLFPNRGEWIFFIIFDKCSCALWQVNEMVS